MAAVPTGQPLSVFAGKQVVFAADNKEKMKCGTIKKVKERRKMKKCKIIKNKRGNCDEEKKKYSAGDFFDVLSVAAWYCFNGRFRGCEDRK